MTQKEIKIKGTAYPVAFNMRTMLNFEEITGKPFFGETFDTLKPRIALILAAVLAADEQTTLTVDMLMQADDWQTVQDIITAYATIMEMTGEFFKVPAVEPKDKEPEPKDDEDETEGKTKN
jgi:hypothetical protein